MNGAQFAQIFCIIIGVSALLAWLFLVVTLMVEEIERTTMMWVLTIGLLLLGAVTIAAGASIHVHHLHGS